MPTYCGLLDDFALRQHDAAIESLQDLNEQLIAAVLFGDRLLVNDGYVVAHRAIHTAVLEPQRSPLTRLVETGYVKILTRNGGQLEVVADVMASGKITSAKKRLEQSWYKEAYRPALQKWSAQLNSPAFDAFVGWPKIRTDDVFRSVAGTAYTSLRAAEPTWDVPLELFHRQLKDTESRRTEWEDVADDLRASNQIDPLVHRALMLTANEAYQYAWGCALGATDSTIRVLTRMPRHLPEFDLPLGQLTGATRQPVQVLVPDLVFASQAIKNRWELLAEVGTPGNRLNILKHRFLACLAQFHVSDSVTQNELQDAADAYGEALSNQFGNPRTIQVAFGLTFLTVGTIAGLIAASPVVVLGIGLAGVAGEALGGPQAFWKLAAPDPRGWTKNLMQAPSYATTSSFQLERSQIDKHTEGASPFP